MENQNLLKRRKEFLSAIQQVDHIVPTIRDGSAFDRQLVQLLRKCNKKQLTLLNRAFPVEVQTFIESNPGI